MNSIKLRARNCGPLSEMLRGRASGNVSFFNGSRTLKQFSGSCSPLGPQEKQILRFAQNDNHRFGGNYSVYTNVKTGLGRNLELRGIGKFEGVDSCPDANGA